MIDNSKEYILCAAIKRIVPKEDNVYYHNDIHEIEIGYRHPDIFRRFKGEVRKDFDAQGFYTSKGRFVDRYEAMRIAYECGQVDEETAIRNKDAEDIEEKFHQMFSEDLYRMD